MHTLHRLTLKDREILRIGNFFIKKKEHVYILLILLYQGKPFDTLFTGSFKHWHPPTHTHTHSIDSMLKLNGKIAD